MFSGSIPALVTPFTAGEVDLPALRDFVDWQITEGSSGLVPCGTTGEVATLTADEHAAVVRATAQAVAVGWQMYDLTGSAWDLGLVGLAQAALDVALGAEEREALAAKPTANLAAYDAYLRGLKYWYDQEFPQAAEHMAEAVRIDSVEGMTNAAPMPMRAPPPMERTIVCASGTRSLNSPEPLAAASKPSTSAVGSASA